MKKYIHFIFNFLQEERKIQLLIFLIASLSYINTIPHEWAVDDAILITDNRFTKRGIAGLDSILSENTFAGYFGNKKVIAGSRWRPLTQVMFAIEVELFAANLQDLQGRVVKDEAGFVVKDLSPESLVPKIAHLINVLFYSLLCVVLYKVLLLLFKNISTHYNLTEKIPIAYFIAAIATLLFTIHPIHTEVVANIKGRDEIISFLGALLALYYTFLAIQVPKIDNITANASVLKYLILAAVFFFLSLLAKESSVTFLAIIPITLYFFSNKKFKVIFSYCIPLLIIFMLFLSLRNSVVGGSPLQYFETDELMNDPFLQVDENAPLAPLLEGAKVYKLVSPNEHTYHLMPYSHRLATIIYSASIYLKLLLVPHPLTIDYYPRHIPVQNFGNTVVWFSVAIHAFLFMIAFWGLRSKQVIAYAILYYFVTFSIFSNFLFVIGTNISERFLFIPSLGFVIIVSYLLYWCYYRYNVLLPVITFFLLICLAYFIKTFERNFDWKNNDTLIAKDITVSKNSAKLNYDYGVLLILQARSEYMRSTDSLALIPEKARVAREKAAYQRQCNKMLAAVPFIEKSLLLHPIYGSAWSAYAAIFYTQAMGTTNDSIRFKSLYYSIASYEQSFKFQPDNSTTPLNLALGYKEMGRFLKERQQDYSKSLFFLEKSYKLNPQDVQTCLLLSTTYAQKAKYTEAVNIAEKALLLEQTTIVKENLATIYQQAGLGLSNASLVLKARNLWLSVREEIQKMPDATKKTMLSTAIEDTLQRNYALEQKIIVEMKNKK